MNFVKIPKDIIVNHLSGRVFVHRGIRLLLHLVSGKDLRSLARRAIVRPIERRKVLKPELRRHVYASEVEEPTLPRSQQDKPSILFTPSKEHGFLPTPKSKGFLPIPGR